MASLSFSYDKGQESESIQNLEEDTYNIGDNTPKQKALLVLVFTLAPRPDVVDAREYSSRRMHTSCGLSWSEKKN